MRLVSACYNEFHPFDTLLGDMLSEAIVIVSPDDLRQGDLLLLWGGIDISPTRYNHPNIASDTGQDVRDKIEFALAQRAEELQIPIIGICRGLQLLTVHNKGTLIQDCDNHATGHQHTVNTHEMTFPVNSYHHQMCVPSKTDDHIVLATSPQLCTQQLIWNNSLEIKAGASLLPNVEAVIWPSKKQFGVQWHPEWMDVDSPATIWIMYVVKEYLLC